MSGLILTGACRQDGVDPRDLDFSDLRDRLLVGQEEVKAGVASDGQVELPERTPISDQGRRPSCVANAGCDSLELIMPDPVVQLSRLFAYKNSRLLHGEGANDNGTYGRTMFQSFSKIGCAPEALWTYDERPESEGGVVNQRPLLAVYEAAYDHKIEGYYAIKAAMSMRADEVEAALRLQHPTFITMQVGQAFADFDGTGDVVWNAPSRPIGRHAMVVVGVRWDSRGRRHFKLRNSWTRGWGEGGYAWATEAWICDPFTSDLWVPTMVPSFVVEP